MVLFKRQLAVQALRASLAPSSRPRHISTTAIRKFNPLIGLEGVIEEIQDDTPKKKTVRIVRREPNILIPVDADSFKVADQDASKKVAKEKKSSTESSSGGNNNNNDDDDGTEYEHFEEKEPSGWDKFKSSLIKSIDTAGITLASLLVLGGAGISYHEFYDTHVIEKMSNAFDKGDEAFELTMHKRTSHREGDWIERPEQRIIDDIISGKLVGRYFLLNGEKGCGKSSMVLNAIQKVDSFNVTILDAHSDPEIFRIRLGKALNFEYHEDYIGSLFSIRGPRDTTALLDIERAFNKLEEVAVLRAKKYGTPLVLIINNTHLIKDDDEGVKLVELLQQKAETLSGAGIATIIFNSDDYWLYERLNKLGTRLEVVNVHDFTRRQALKALEVSRLRYFNEHVDDTIANQVYDLIGGRPQHLAEVVKQADMIKASHKLIDREKTWFLNQCGLLGRVMDDDVNDSGKFSAAAMLLMRQFVEMYDAQLPRHGQTEDHKLPELPLWRARQIMTRNDFIQLYDNLNIFSIDSNSFVRPDSVPMMRGFLEIATQPGFEDLLEDTIERIDEIESLGRTREVVIKDLVRGSSFKVEHDNNGYTVKLHQKKEEGDSDPIKLQPTTKKEGQTFWKKRLAYKPPLRESDDENS